jgi:hypothetical protein
MAVIERCFLKENLYSYLLRKNIKSLRIALSMVLSFEAPNWM